MVSSGQSSLSTVDDTPVTLITAAAESGYQYAHIVLLNEGGVAGLFSVDGGTTWCRLQAGVVLDDLPFAGKGVMVKRLPGSTDVLTGLWAYAY